MSLQRLEGVESPSKGQSSVSHHPPPPSLHEVREGTGARGAWQSRERQPEACPSCVHSLGIGSFSWGREGVAVPGMEAKETSQGREGHRGSAPAEKVEKLPSLSPPAASPQTPGWAHWPLPGCEPVPGERLRSPALWGRGGKGPKMGRVRGVVGYRPRLCPVPPGSEELDRRHWALTSPGTVPLPGSAASGPCP